MPPINIQHPLHKEFSFPITFQLQLAGLSGFQCSLHFSCHSVTMLSNKVLVFFKKAPSVKQTPYYPLFGSRLSASQIRELAKLKKHKSPFRRPLLPSLPQTNIPSLYNTSRRLYSTNISSTHSTEITYTPEGSLNFQYLPVCPSIAHESSIDDCLLS